MTYLSPAPVRFVQSLIWAVVVWTALQLPVIQQSFVGAPDKVGLQNVLQLQRNLVGGDATPVAVVDFGDGDWLAAAARKAPAAPAPAVEAADPAQPTPPPETGTPVAQAAETYVPEQNVPLYVPRQALAEVLDFLAGSGAVAVFVDVDTSYAPSPQDDRLFADAIARWRARPDAPLLTLARTNWVTPSIFARNGMEEPGPNDRIVEGTVRIWSDAEQVVDNVEYWTCEGAAGARQPRASVTLYLAAAARFDDGLKGKQAVSDALARVPCDRRPRTLTLDVPGGDMAFPAQDGPIHYHLDLNRLDDGSWSAPRWPPATLRPSAAARCGQDTRAAAALLRVSDLLAGLDEGGVSTSALCGGVVVVGASAEIVRDIHPTPYGDMPGAFILANAARGLDLSGPLRRYPYFVGLGLVAVISIVVFLVHDTIYRWSNRFLMRPRRTTAGKAARWVVDKVTHPLTFSFLITNLLFLVGLVLTFFMIRDGYWGVFAASALAASLSNAFDDVSGMRKVLLAPKDLEETT
ncbi:MAG: CHASE2 domain-containing protein [Hyphomonadaceae bacterium]|nr:CHASE2 domain-containing protein [Hyphomonadaceae bacterium]